jgi:hypothetical protein
MSVVVGLRYKPIFRLGGFLVMDMSRKLTVLFLSTINFLSNQPLEHKMAAYQFLIRRMLSLPIDSQQRHAEWQYIHNTRCAKQQLPSSPNIPAETLHKEKTLSLHYPSPLSSDDKTERHKVVRVHFFYPLG